MIVSLVNGTIVVKPDIGQLLRVVVLVSLKRSEIQKSDVEYSVLRITMAEARDRDWKRVRYDI